MGPLPCQSGQQVLQLRQLNLQLSFVAVRALSKDVENELAAIDDSHVERRFEIALLRRGQVFIKDHQIGAQIFEARLNLLDFSPADKRRRGNASELLRKFLRDFGAGS